MGIKNPEETAIEFYANMFFYYSVCDGAADEKRLKSYKKLKAENSYMEDAGNDMLTKKKKFKEIAKYNKKRSNIRARRLRRRAVNFDTETSGLSVFIFKRGYKRNGKK